MKTLKKIKFIIKFLFSKYSFDTFESVYEELKKLRQEKGYTSQETFAYDHGYTLSYYSRLERGEDIRFSSLLKVSEALGVTLEEFFEGIDIPKGNKKKKK